MIASESMRGAAVAVLGLGASGRSTCRSLAAGGASVWAWDDADAPRRAAARAGIPIVCLDACNWARCSRLVVSPGIPHRHPRPHRLVRRARAARVEVAGDIELLVENQPDRAIVGITGTNGKSTTTALVGHLLRNAGRGVQVGGNIGLPVLDLLPKPENDLYVLELSSFQLELTDHLACRVAVILNISADHLARHGGMAGYVRAKRRILRNQRASDVAIIGVDDEWGREIVDDLRRRRGPTVIPISAREPVDGGLYVAQGQVIDATQGRSRMLADCADSEALRGRHNWQNTAAAFAVVRALGADLEAARRALPTFAGLPHRMEPVGRLGPIRFVNDSKATNAEAAARSLASFDQVFWIAGGRPKEGGLGPLDPHLERVRHAYLIGEAAEPFAHELHGRVPLTLSGDLRNALIQATAAARGQPGAAERTVLLAPACASFDQFANFEARGDAFRRLVAEIVNAEPPS
ncbi:MAG: UDP-N-acetylmuramoyl-L-alanine--D-glutamate ligase [Geminicoccaceae bacterium]|nr:UDP-N-acetylmuramoyl-L-alanine--D-glutamate ligase [Geminicoccaceae bacterium]